MDALGSLEEIAEQANHRVNERTSKRRGSGFGWQVSPNLARASVPRSKKEKKPAPPKLAEPPPEQRQQPTCAKLGRAFSDYKTLVEICRHRAAELEMSRAELDRTSGVPDGYSGKVLGKKAVRKLGVWSLELMLGALGLKLVVIEDEAATSRVLAQRVPVEKNQQRFGNVCRLSAKLLEKPSQPASPPLLRVVPAKRSARGSKYG